MIIKEMHLIESKLDDFNSPKKQVWKTIHFRIKDKDSETYFVMLNMVDYEKRCFEEDWSKNWQLIITEEKIETASPSILPEFQVVLSQQCLYSINKNMISTFIHILWYYLFYCYRLSNYFHLYYLSLYCMILNCLIRIQLSLSNCFLSRQ